MDKRLIRASICYDDDAYDPSLARRAAEILVRWGFDAPSHIYAGRLTGERFLPAEDWQTLLARGYGEMGVHTVEIASGDSTKEGPFRGFRIDMTFRKNPKAQPSAFCPWNVMTLTADAAQMEDPAALARLLDCTKSLIRLTNPISADVDELGRAVRRTRQTREQHYVREGPRQVYWGNYWGPDWLARFPEGIWKHLSAERRENLSGGVFFTLSESPLGWQNPIIRRCILHAIHESERKR